MSHSNQMDKFHTNKMYNCFLLSLTIFTKEITHVSVSAHIKWKSDYLLHDNQNTDSSYLQVERNKHYKYRGTLLELRFT